MARLMWTLMALMALMGSPEAAAWCFVAAACCTALWVFLGPRGPWL